MSRAGAGAGGSGRDDAARHVDHAGLHQQLAAAGRLHEGHRRLVGRLRHLRLLRALGVRAGQLRVQVSSELLGHRTLHRTKKHLNFPLRGD